MQSNSVFHEFEVDKSIITDLIHAQNGTVSTALRELVMNAIDAGSKRCDIQINSSSFSVADTGEGFKSKENIEKVFKRFGEPHKEGDAVFGRFRIGRGQIMSFGAITWHSNNFKMHTDVRQFGNGFKLEEKPKEHYSGCHVSGCFYEELSQWDLLNVKTDLIKLVKYADLVVTINGVDITETQSTQWDIDDDDVKIKWTPNRRDGIHLYSLGVFVKNIERYRYGLDADIVTKRALTLNMARNEINDIDPLWKIIDGHLKAQSLIIANKKQRMTEDTRKSMIYQIISGEVSLVDVFNLPLVRDCRGQCVSFKTLLSRSMPVSIAPDKSRVADTIASRKTATILHHDELRLWEVNSLEEWQDILIHCAIMSNAPSWVRRYLSQFCWIEFDDLKQGFNESLTILKPSSLSPRISAGKNALSYASKIMSKRLSKHNNEAISVRKILIGESTVADGWTDGLSYIAINKKMVALLDNGYYGAVQLALLLLHEYCHDTQDYGSHEHDFAFYERFHDLSSTYHNEIIGHTATSMFKRYQDELVQKNESLPKEVKRNFKYPIINNTIDLTGTLEGALTPLAKQLLDMSPIRYRIRGNTIHAVYKSWDGTKYNKIPKFIESLIEKSGIKCPDEKFISRMTDDYKKANKIIIKEWDKVYEEYALKENISVNFLKKLHGCYSPESLFKALCSDSSGLKSFEYRSLINTRTIGSSSYLHTFKSTDWQMERTPSFQFANSSALRTEYALNGIKRIINGITETTERELFIKTFLTDNLRNQINN
ncbi:hypothetical protein GLP30_17165 [Photobacterium phosphoreum]|uniref:ATP-binding protein n=1 Tax=Photobacterium phosphoreum TaxID=659 RepID=A0AAW4ZWG3_PHOPO|nr:ATP-binding protein [Photobacterium phosphoreum]MCD9492616.1 hypothetical protein [Photobacterium phosphoreum]MCF2191819.1 hypothetical protein [Photobacterium phosphoreum]MCF2303448.1 hypothetical protein [Photobacterium phosphoreum]